MVDMKSQRGSVAGVIEKYGHCVELVPVDERFHQITIGLYVKDKTATVWTFSRKPGVEKRVQEIRDNLVAMGGMTAVKGTHNQATYACGMLHEQALKILVPQTVERAPVFTFSGDQISTPDTKSKLVIVATPEEKDGDWSYSITAQGSEGDKAARISAVSNGLARYGGMEKSGDNTVAFPCRQRHDSLVRLLLPYACNVSAAEELSAASPKGQMTASSLGFGR